MGNNIYSTGMIANRQISTTPIGVGAPGGKVGGVSKLVMRRALVLLFLSVDGSPPPLSLFYCL
jgi:hypothetical protein